MTPTINILWLFKIALEICRGKDGEAINCPLILIIKDDIIFFDCTKVPIN